MTVREYRVKGTVNAEVVNTAGHVHTRTGVVWANAGDYLVHDNGTHVVNAEDFEKNYEPVNVSEPFHPAGKTVESVVEFMKSFPEEVNRIKAEEEAGAKRKGILEFA